MPVASSGVHDRPGAGGGAPDVEEGFGDCDLAPDFLPIGAILPCLGLSGLSSLNWRLGRQNQPAGVGKSAVCGPRGVSRAAWYRFSVRRAYLAWIAVCVIWGTTYLGIRIALETIPPLLMASMRWISAGGLLIVMLALRGERLPARREWPSLAILGILLLGFGNGAVVWAEQTVPSGLTAVLVATSPFWMVGIDALMPDGEAIVLRRVIGLVIGFGGIVMLVWPQLRFDGSGGGFLGGVIAAQIACVGWAVGSSYARKRGRGDASGENVLATAAFEMLLGGIALLIVSLALHETARLRFTPRTTGALLYLIFVGAIGGFSAYAYALKHLPVATVSLYAYVNPIIAVVLGALVLGEPLDARMVLAAIVVFIGVAMVRSR
ncbi:MAG TPA: EamA family transporter [Vicinamibacterales bacterium]|nr:EamA family transporter [Vicinamibacterales bacterium]